jgi:hypothetical protein
VQQLRDKAMQEQDWEEAEVKTGRMFSHPPRFFHKTITFS